MFFYPEGPKQVARRGLLSGQVTGFPFNCTHWQNLREYTKRQTSITLMSAKEWIRHNGLLTLTILICLIVAVLAGSFVIDPPEHLSGTVIEKIYVPSNLRYADTPYGGTKRAAYSIRVVKEEQWIAVVRTDAGDTLTVHCHPDHYGQKEVGDRIKFREYQGSLIHISYLAHGEQEGD